MGSTGFSMVVALFVQVLRIWLDFNWFNLYIPDFTGLSLFFTRFFQVWRVLLGFTELYRVLTSFHRVLANFSSFTAFYLNYPVFAVLLGFHWFLPNFSWFRGFLLGFTEFYRVFSDFLQFLTDFSGFYWVFFTGFYLFFFQFLRFYWAFIECYLIFQVFTGFTGFYSFFFSCVVHVLLLFCFSSAQVGAGTLGGKFTTLEGLLVAMKDQLFDHNPLLCGDSATAEAKGRPMKKKEVVFPFFFCNWKKNWISLAPTGLSTNGDASGVEDGDDVIIDGNLQNGWRNLRPNWPTSSRADVSATSTWSSTIRPATVTCRFVATLGKFLEKLATLAPPIFQMSKKSNVEEEEEEEEEDVVLHSFIRFFLFQNVYAPDDDPEMVVEHYERTFEHNEELGLNDMNVDNYRVDDPPAGSPWSM